MYTCPSCHKDLDDCINRGIETGLWRFRLKCECGDILMWDRNRRLRSIHGVYTKEPVA